jgi:hypothetical protein
MTGSPSRKRRSTEPSSKVRTMFEIIRGEKS